MGLPTAFFGAAFRLTGAFLRTGDFLTGAFFLAGVLRFTGAFLAGLFWAGFDVSDASLTFLSVVSVYVHVTIGLPAFRAASKMARVMLQIFHFRSPIVAENLSKSFLPADVQCTPGRVVGMALWFLPLPTQARARPPVIVTPIPQQIPDPDTGHQ